MQRMTLSDLPCLLKEVNSFVVYWMEVSKPDRNCCNCLSKAGGLVEINLRIVSKLLLTPPTTTTTNHHYHQFWQLTCFLLLRKLKMSGVNFLNFLPLHHLADCMPFTFFLPISEKEGQVSFLRPFPPPSTITPPFWTNNYALLLVYSLSWSRLNSLPVRKAKPTNLLSP